MFWGRDGNWMICTDLEPLHINLKVELIGRTEVIAVLRVIGWIDDRIMCRTLCLKKVFNFNQSEDKGLAPIDHW
jgi:hypothetical protein